MQEIPVSPEFSPMDLRPRLDQPALGLRQAAAETLECLGREYRGVLLIVRVKVRMVMRFACLHEHADDDPEESRELRHTANLASSG